MPTGIFPTGIFPAGSFPTGIFSSVVASTSGLDDLDFPLTAVISSKTYTAVLDQ